MNRPAALINIYKNPRNHQSICEIMCNFKAEHNFSIFKVGFNIFYRYYKTPEILNKAVNQDLNFRSFKLLYTFLNKKRYRGTYIAIKITSLMFYSHLICLIRYLKIQFQISDKVDGNIQRIFSQY